MTYPYVVPPTSKIVPADVIVFRKGNLAVAIKGDTKEVIASSTDHAEAIQKAIDYVSDVGGAVFLKGRFRLAHEHAVYMRSNVVLDGGGPAVLEMEGVDGYRTNLNIIAHRYGQPDLIENVTIRGLKIIPVGAAKEAENLDTGTVAEFAGIVINADTGYEVRNVLIEDVEMEGDRTAFHTGDWSRYDGVNESLLVIKNVYVRNMRIYHRGDSKNPIRPVQPRDFDTMVFYNCHFMGRDWRAGVPHDPSKSGIMAVNGVRLYVINTLFDGAHHNDFEGRVKEAVFAGCVFRESDDCLDFNNAKKVTVTGCVGVNSGRFVSPEFDSEDITVTGCYIENCSFLGGSNSRRITMVGNIGIVPHFFVDNGGLEDVIIEGNHLRITSTVYTHRSTTASRGIFIRNNVLKLEPGADHRIIHAFYAIDPADDLVQDFHFVGNEVWGSSTDKDLSIWLGDYRDTTKYYCARRVFIHDNVFRNCRYCNLIAPSDHDSVYVWHNVVMGYVEGGSNQFRWSMPDLGTVAHLAQEAIRMKVSFDASVTGAQTTTVDNHCSLIPRINDTESYAALATIRSAPSGWQGYVIAKPNPSEPWSKVDVTLVTTTTATGTVEVDVLLIETEPQGYGYVMPKMPRWKR